MKNLNTLITSLLLIVPVLTWAGPGSAYYLVNGDGKTIYVVQGNSIIDTFSMTNNIRQYPIAIADTVRTTGYNSGEIGQEYELDGTPTGSTYTLSGVSGLVDGTTNGVDKNFAANFSTGNVYEFDRSWQNANFLFSAGSDFGGITYDSSNDTLWLNSRATGETRNYTLTGTQISSFTASSSVDWALAYEQATDSLWYIGDDKNTLYNYSKTGTLVEQVSIPGLSGNILGGEFSNVPEPSVAALLTGLGALGFVVCRRKKASNAELTKV